MARGIRVLFIVGREPAYHRNAVILKGLLQQGVQVVECTDTSATYGGRYARLALKLLSRLESEVDVVYVGFFGQPLVPIVNRLFEKPLLFDAHLSAFDTLCHDRQAIRPNSSAGRFLFWLDRTACELADRVLLDTTAHIRYFTSTFGVPASRFQRVFVGADDDLFQPRESAQRSSDFVVLYYATYLPLHGVPTVIKAAARLARERAIRFRVIGRGPETSRVQRLHRRLGARNVEFVPWVPYHTLPQEIANADLCLGGHFSSIPKASRVIPGKAFQVIAMKKPIILGDNEANRELFRHKRDALLVEMADSEALADGILRLKEDEELRKHIGGEGYKTFRARCSKEVIGKQVRTVMEELAAEA